MYRNRLTIHPSMLRNYSKWEYIFILVFWNRFSISRFNEWMHMWDYQYRISHCGEKTILWLSYLHSMISYISKMTSLYWTSNGSWCIGIKGEMSGTVCVTFTWDIYIYIYIWVVYSFCLFCCLFIIVTWWYIWCIVWQVSSKRKYRHVW